MQQIYQPLNGGMTPTTLIPQIKYINTMPRSGKVYSGSAIQRFPDNLKYCTMEIGSATYVFLVENMNWGGAIHFYRVTHISKYTKSGLVTVDGGPDRLVDMHYQHINRNMMVRPLLMNHPVDISFLLYVMVWILIAATANLLQYHTNWGCWHHPVAQAMLIDLCTKGFKFRRIYLDRQIIIAAGLAGMRRVMQFILPSSMHAIIWLAAFHYQPMPCMIVSSVCLADYRVMIAIKNAHYVGKLVYILIAVALGLTHIHYPKAFLPFFAVVSVCVIAHLLELDPLPLAAMAAEAMRSTKQHLQQ